MAPGSQHLYRAKVSFDGGDLDCGNGLLLLIRKHIDPIAAGDLLEILSTELSVTEELPAWCRLTGNELVSHARQGSQHSFLVSKGPFTPPDQGHTGAGPAVPHRGKGLPRQQYPVSQPIQEIVIPQELPRPSPALEIAPLAVMGIGSWPRPRWMLEALHQYLEGRLSEEEFQETADDAVRLCVDAQARAGVAVITDGEQRRDSYASFVGSILDNCQLIPIIDLLPYVEDSERFRQELEALDVPREVRHPAVFGPLGRSRPIALHELNFTRQLTGKPVKIALPGPYLLTRTMWMECISDRAYASREELAEDVVRVLREELHFLLAGSTALVQFDEPVLTEVVYGRSEENRTFMCGALGDKLDVPEELDFAESLINRVVEGLPAERLALHVCRGNWSRDEGIALTGDYHPLLSLLSNVRVGTLFLEMCTPRAGEMEALKSLPSDRRIGLGVVNQKLDHVEEPEEIVSKAEAAINIFGPDRLLLNPDCGFATFADNPIASAKIAEQKLASMVAASDKLLRKHKRVPS